MSQKAKVKSRSVTIRIVPPCPKSEMSNVEIVMEDLYIEELPIWKLAKNTSCNKTKHTGTEGVSTWTEKGAFYCKRQAVKSLRLKKFGSVLCEIAQYLI